MEQREIKTVLPEPLAHIHAAEQETLQQEKSLKTRERNKKQVLLRLTPSLWNEISAWAAEDFRSINGQIEYLLAQSVCRRKNKTEDGGSG